MAKVRDPRHRVSGFAKRLRSARVAHGYTQEVFSRLLGIKRDRYAKYELGHAEPPFFILGRVSELTQQSLDTLIGGKTVRNHETLRIVGTQLSDLQAISGIQSSWWWKTDREHRLAEVWHLHNHIPQNNEKARGIGKTRWELVGADLEKDASWRQHQEDLDSHLVFDNFRFAYVSRDGKPRAYCVSGKPVFDDSGLFQGYSGYGYVADSSAGAIDSLKLSSSME